MIQRLKIKDIINIHSFLLELQKVQILDFYVTKDNNRILLQNNLKEIQKILKQQKCYGKFEGDILVSIFIIYKEKNYRPYLKIAGNKNDIEDLLRFFKWHYFEKEIYCKLNKRNPIIFQLQKSGFYKIGDRGIKGNEILLVKKCYKMERVDGHSNFKD